MKSTAADPLPLLAELAAAVKDERAAIAADGPQQLSLRAQLEATGSTARAAMLESHVQRVAARVLKLQPDRLDPAKPFGAMGMDSLMGVQLRNRLEIDLGLRLPTTLAWNYPTVKAMSANLLDRLFDADLLADTPPAPASIEPVAANENGAQLATLITGVQQMSDDEALLALLDGRRS